MRFERMPTVEVPESSPTYDLFDIEEAAGDDPDLKEIFEDVRQGVFDYFERSLAFQSINRETSNDDTQEIDRAKRLTHNGLISNLTILARNAKKAGRQTPWWDGPGGFFKGTKPDRHLIADWAIKEASRVLQRDLRNRYEYYV